MPERSQELFLMDIVENELEPLKSQIKIILASL